MADFGNRSTYEICRDIINALLIGGPNLSARAHVSTEQKEKYFRDMADSGIVKCVEGSNGYEVTEKGKKFNEKIDGLLLLLR